MYEREICKPRDGTSEVFKDLRESHAEYAFHLSYDLVEGGKDLHLGPQTLDSPLLCVPYLVQLFAY